jgi:hypothetical protein
MAIDTDEWDDPIYFPPVSKYASDMTLRQWCAGQALVGLIVAFADRSEKGLAEWAFAQADAMIEAEANDATS